MSDLAPAVVGSRRPGAVLNWTKADGTYENLEGAVITGSILSVRSSVTRTITGPISVTNAVQGEFLWEYSAADVSTFGLHYVQFQATYPTGLSPTLTFNALWVVEMRL